MSALTTQSGMRFLVVPVIGMPQNIVKDGAFIFLMRIVVQLIAQGNYCYVVVPQGADTTPWENLKGVMFIHSSIPTIVYRVQRTVIDTAILGECFAYHYGRYTIDAAIVMTGQHALALKMALASDLYDDTLPVFCVEQGVSWFDSEPGHKAGGFNDHLHALGSSYAHMIWVSERDKRMYLEKAEYNGMTPSRIKQMDQDGFVASVPIDLGHLQKHKVKKNKKKVTALFAARANATKHPEVIIDIFDELYKQGEPLDVVFMSQTTEMIGEGYTNRNEVWDEREYITPRWGCGVDDFYAQAAKSHIYICWSDSESYNVSAGEAALLGCVFLCKDSKDHRELFRESLTDDHFWLTSKQDAIEKVRWVVNNYDQAFAMQEGLRQKYLMDTQDKNPAEIILQATAHHMQKNADEKLYNCGPIKPMLDQIVPGLKYPVTYHEILTLIDKSAMAFRLSNMGRASSHKMPVDWQIHGYLRQLGLKDDCSSRFPIYGGKDE